MIDVTKWHDVEMGMEICEDDVEILDSSLVIPGRTALGIFMGYYTYRFRCGLCPSIKNLRVKLNGLRDYVKHSIQLIANNATLPVNPLIILVERKVEISSLKIEYAIQRHITKDIEARASIQNYNLLSVTEMYGINLEDWGRCFVVAVREPYLIAQCLKVAGKKGLTYDFKPAYLRVGPS